MMKIDNSVKSEEAFKYLTVSKNGKFISLKKGDVNYYSHGGVRKENLNEEILRASGISNTDKNIIIEYRYQSNSMTGIKLMVYERQTKTPWGIIKSVRERTAVMSFARYPVPYSLKIERIRKVVARLRAVHDQEAMLVRSMNIVEGDTIRQSKNGKYTIVLRNIDKTDLEAAYTLVRRVFDI